MKITALVSGPAMPSAAVFAFLLVSRASLPADELTPGNLKGSVTMELIGQAQVLSPQAAIQFGYLSRIEGLETIFTGTPQNESTAMFTFYNDTDPVWLAGNCVTRGKVVEHSGVKRDKMADQQIQPIAFQVEQNCRDGALSSSAGR